MPKAVVIIPNLNGLKFLHGVLDSLRRQECRDFRTILVDNGSTDGSAEYVEDKYPEVELIRLKENTGFCFAVNEGIRRSTEPYVILLNNDTAAGKHFVGEMIAALDAHPHAFSAGAMMRRMDKPNLIDDSGDYYCSLGWAFTMGKGENHHRFAKPGDVFAACAGAAVYRRSMMEQTGLFDESQFAYLEDIDIGWRAKILGYRNIYAPGAQVLHYGSGSSGSRYNPFKVTLSARNSIYIIYKNMPVFQILLNLPFLTAGFTAKAIFFTVRGFGKEYRTGLRDGFALCRTGGNKKVKFRPEHMVHYIQIQAELWVNTFRRLMD